MTERMKKNLEIDKMGDTNYFVVDSFEVQMPCILRHVTKNRQVLIEIYINSDDANNLTKEVKKKYRLPVDFLVPEAQLDEMYKVEYLHLSLSGIHLNPRKMNKKEMQNTNFHCNGLFLVTKYKEEFSSPFKVGIDVLRCLEVEKKVESKDLDRIAKEIGKFKRRSADYDSDDE